MERMPTNPAEGHKLNANEFYAVGIGPISEILWKLQDLAPDAFEIFGGAEEVWHIEETPLPDSGAHIDDFDAAQRIVREYYDIATSPDTDGTRKAKLDKKHKEFMREFYGLPL